MEDCEYSIKKLKQWFVAQQRDLPWRGNPSPYAVWVSEVMLQQTQVAVVVPYFERWMRLFPTIEALAKAPIEAVLKEWEGLGYYARARNLHEGARTIVEHYHGKIPTSAEKLKEIKGLGDYTVGAILSFAYHQRVAAVDGNVMRVLVRYYCLSDDISKGPTQKKIRALANELLPQDESWIVNEALIELGATICARMPKCEKCPLRETCMAYAMGKAEQLPIKSVKIATQLLFRLVPVIFSQGKVLVGCGVKGKVMADLFEFPYFDIDNAPGEIEDQVVMMREKLKLDLALSAKWQQVMPQVKHSFTRYRALLMPHLYIAKEPKEIPGYDWFTIEELMSKPFSSGHRRIFADVQSLQFAS